MPEPPPIAPFSTPEALRFGWRATLGHLEPLLLLGLAGAVLAFLQSGLSGGPAAGGLARALLSLLLDAVQVGLTMLWIRTALRLYDGQAPALSQWSGLSARFWTFLLAMVLYTLVVAGGLLLLVVPGVIWGLRYGLIPFLVVDQGLGAREAFGRSRRLTSGVEGRLLVLGLALAGLNLLGALALGLGLLLTVPTSFLAAAFVYRRLVVRGEQPLPAPQAPSPLPAPSSGTTA